MMKLKWLRLACLVSLSLAACSESNYTPIATNAYRQVLPGQTGYVAPPQTINPYISSTTPYYQQSPQAQASLNAQILATSSCQARLNLPGFYLNLNANTNCLLRKHATYTPSYCRCIVAENCNCDTEIRRSRRYYVTTRPGTPVEIIINQDNNTQPSTSSNPPTNPPTTPSGPKYNSISSPDLYVTITGKDAEALWKNLHLVPYQVEARSNSTYRCVKSNNEYFCTTITESTDGGLFGTEAKVQFDGMPSVNLLTYIKVGPHYTCIADQDVSTGGYKNFNCDFDIVKASGIVKIANAVSAIATDKECFNTYIGPSVQLEEGPGKSFVRIAGQPADELYAKLVANTECNTAHQFYGTSAQVSTNAKKQGHVSCFQVAENGQFKTECFVLIDSVPGKALLNAGAPQVSTGVNNNTPVANNNNTPVANNNNTPAATNNAPAATNNAPAATNNAPAATNNAPAATNNAPAATNNAPVATNNAPDATNNAPAVNNNTGGNTNSNTNSWESFKFSEIKKSTAVLNKDAKWEFVKPSWTQALTAKETYELLGDYKKDEKTIICSTTYFINSDPKHAVCVLKAMGEDKCENVEPIKCAGDTSIQKIAPPVVADTTPTETTPTWISYPFQDIEKSTVTYSEETKTWIFTKPLVSTFAKKTYKLNAPLTAKENPAVCLGNFIDVDGKTKPTVCVMKSMNATSCADIKIAACLSDKTIELIAPKKP